MRRARVLLVDMSEHGVGAAIERMFCDARDVPGVDFDSLRIQAAEAGAAALDLQGPLSSARYALAVFALPGNWQAGALDALSAVWRGCRQTRVVLVATAAGVEDLERAWRLGAREICVWPIHPAELVFRIKRLLDCDGGEDLDVQSLKETLGLQQIVGRSPAILEILKRVPMLARSGATLLIRGETGTGKEVFARAVHYLSGRSHGPFVPVNCGAIPADLLENELFGHAAGAFTGAAGGREGVVAEAEAGTLFLDEVDALPPSAQVKLLRLLQEKEYRPLGSARSRQANIRVVAASNANLEQALADGRFRRDLYYRLDVLSIVLPPLRDRASDVLDLAEHFLGRFEEQYAKPQLQLTLDARHRMLVYDWPGNVRQLENVMERAVITCTRQQIDAQHIELPSTPGDDTIVGFQQTKAHVVQRFERDYLCRLLALHHGNISQAARTAGKNRRAFFELIRKHGIAVQSFSTGARP